MYCVYCGGDRFERRAVDHPIRHGDRIIGVVTVEADVCLQCHEYYLDKSALQRIKVEREKLLKQAPAR